MDKVQNKPNSSVLISVVLKTLTVCTYLQMLHVRSIKITLRIEISCITCVHSNKLLGPINGKEFLE
jgi:hypothetical protein